MRFAYADAGRRRMTEYSLTLNEYATPVMARRCTACEREFTVCPVPRNLHDWTDCLATDCPSYDPSRDIDGLWDHLQERGHIVRDRP
jgi:hypothetical protein